MNERVKEKKSDVQSYFSLYFIISSYKVQINQVQIGFENNERLKFNAKNLGINNFYLKLNSKLIVLHIY